MVNAEIAKGTKNALCPEPSSAIATVGNSNAVLAITCLNANLFEFKLKEFFIDKPPNFEGNRNAHTVIATRSNKIMRTMV